MKRTLILLFIFSFVRINAQTVDEIIQKYGNAMGGLENFKKTKTAKLTGTVEAQGNTFPITIQIVNGKAMRTDVEVMSQKIVNCYKDGKGWKINPFAGAAAATDVTGDELTELKNQSFLTSPLVDYKDRGYKVELLGQEDVNGTKAYKIALTTDDNKKDTYYISTTTFMPIKFVGTRNMMGQDMEVETLFGDLKDFGNLKFNTSRTISAGGQTIQEIHFDKIELDIPIDDKIFDKE